MHVDDLSRAHIAAFDQLGTPGTQLFYNLGTGGGTSVREVIAACEKVTGKPIKVIEKPRRAGDPPLLIAGSDKVKRELGWTPKYQAIEKIVESAWAWHQRHPLGYQD